MNITVQELTSVDKEIKIEASREDLTPKFEKAIRKYRGQINMPGFRPGKTPLGIIKKRYGKEIELEEINSYIQEIYEKEIVPEYEPIGETQMVNMNWENDMLEVVFKVGAKPDFELKELEEITIDKMVHDVAEEEVEEEIDRTLERKGNWEEIDEKITEECRVTVDAISLDKDDNPIESEKDENQKLDLRQDAAKEFREKLVGKKAGDVVKMDEEEDETSRFEMHIKKVEVMKKAELDDELAKQQSNGQAKNVDEFRGFIKSQMQQYYDQSSVDMFRQFTIDELTNAHDFEIPEVMKDQILNSYVEYAKQQSGGSLPENFDAEEYKEKMNDQAVREIKWVFISQKLQEKFDDIEIKPEDIDEYLGAEAARYGVTLDQIRNVYSQNPSQLESLRTNIRESKIFDKLAEVVKVNELSKEEFRKKRETEKENETQKSE